MSWNPGSALGGFWGPRTLVHCKLLSPRRPLKGRVESQGSWSDQGRSSGLLGVWGPLH